MRIRQPFTLCAIACATAVVILAALILRPVVIANSIRNEMLAFHAGTFSAERLRKWATDHAGRITCDGNRCEADVTVLNWPLYALGLAPQTAFDASISTKDGDLDQILLRLTDLNYSIKPWGATTQLVKHFSDPEPINSRLGPHGVHVAQEPIGKPPGVFYSVDLRASLSDVALAQEINVWCLARIGGCAGSEQAPRVWALRRRKD